jgi:hypothetical protein
MVSSLCRLKTLEFLALLMADTSQMPGDLGLDLENETCQSLGASVSSQLKQAVRQGTLVEGRLEILARGILDSLSL